MHGLADRVCSALILPVMCGALAAQSPAAPDAAPDTTDPGVATAPVACFGRLVDVYGLRRDAGTGAIELHCRDVLVGPSLLDHQHAGCRRLPCNPHSLRARLLIDHEVGSAGFAAVLRRLEASAPGLGADVPRDAAVRITWPAAGSAVGDPVGEPMRLLDRATGAAVPFRTIRRDASVTVDPVVTGAEAARRGIADTFGMPEAAMRLRAADGAHALVLDFRARGTLPSTEPPRLVGTMVAHLEQVGRLDEHTRVVSLFLGGVRQALSRGDVLCVHDRVSGRTAIELEVLADVPVASIGENRRAHVCVRAATGERGEDPIEGCDPSNLPAFPACSGPARDAFVRANGPKVTMVTLFDASRGDDPANFVRIGAKEVVDTDANRIDVAPDAAFELRFSARVDPGTLSALRLTMADAEVPIRVSDVDGTARSFRVQAPLGLALTPAMRETILAQRDRPPAERSADYVLTVPDGPNGVRSPAGDALPSPLVLGFVVDPSAADNHVGWQVFRR